MKSQSIVLASILIVSLVGCGLALAPKEYFIFDVPNDGPALIHTIDALNGAIVSSISIPLFDSVNISASHVFFHEMEQKFYLWQELPSGSSEEEGPVSNNIRVYGIIAKTAEVKTSVQVLDPVLGRNYKAVNYDIKNDKIVAFGECIYQITNNSTKNGTVPSDPEIKREFRTCVIAVDHRSGNISQYWMADKDYNDNLSPYAGAADLSNHVALLVYKNNKGHQSVCQYSIGPNTRDLHIPKTYFNGSYASGCLNTRYQEFFFSFNVMPNQQNIYAMLYNVSSANVTTSLVYFGESSHLKATTLLTYPAELRPPFQDMKSKPFVTHLSHINSELYQLWFNASQPIDEEGSLRKFNFVILSNLMNQKEFKLNLTIAGSAEKMSYVVAMGVAYDAGVSTTALVVIVVCVVLLAGGGTFGIVMCMKKRSADDFEML